MQMHFWWFCRKRIRFCISHNLPTFPSAALDEMGKAFHCRKACCGAGLAGRAVWLHIPIAALRLVSLAQLGLCICQAGQPTSQTNRQSSRLATRHRKQPSSFAARQPGSQPQPAKRPLQPGRRAAQLASQSATASQPAFPVRKAPQAAGQAGNLSTGRRVNFFTSCQGGCQWRCENVREFSRDLFFHGCQWRCENVREFVRELFFHRK